MLSITVVSLSICLYHSNYTNPALEAVALERSGQVECWTELVARPMLCRFAPMFVSSIYSFLNMYVHCPFRAGKVFNRELDFDVLTWSWAGWRKALFVIL